MVDRAVSLAEKDPEAFVQNGRRVVRALGQEAERAYQAHRRDPKLVGRIVKNKLISYAAKAVRRST